MNSSTIVETNYGVVQGVLTLSLLSNVFYSYLGIPYAKPPIGVLRFKDPQLPEPWSGVWNATEESVPCWERDVFSGEYRGSEDCLYLNIFTHEKRPTSLKPVIVFIYPGAFNYGSASLNLTGPDYIMQKDVVLVTFNFRQGVFGYLRVPDESFNISGNFGLKDQSFALRWVKENIRNFGGDPNNVLLFGYSSGACAVNYQMLSEWSRDLFNKAIIMSGSVLNTRFATPENENFYVKRLAAAVGWNLSGGLQSAVNILLNANASDMIQAHFQPNFLLPEDLMKGIRFPYGPVIETKHSGFMPIDPRLRARNSWSNHIPLILTNAADEALILRPAAVAKGENLLSTINFAKLVPTDTGCSYSDSELEALGERIKSFYFGGEDTSQEKILDNFVRMESDRLYVHGK
ncbi:hypothetical protein HA402_000685 [Bradysia odoriphaga]|nr:hypothetical protein HA402_000685 [Bradysia odoriphaga]